MGLKVYLSVSPLAKRHGLKAAESGSKPPVTQRRVRIHWVSVPSAVADQGPTAHDKIALIAKTPADDDEPREGDAIGLFSSTPNFWSFVDGKDECAPSPDWREKALAIFDPTKYPAGVIVTQYEVLKYNFREVDLSRPKNLGFFCGYIRDGRILSIASLSTHPTWMKLLGPYIGHIPLRKLMIPGTHGSGSYQEYRGAASESLIVKYAMTQEEHIFNQLVLGIRYLDLRIGYHTGTFPQLFSSGESSPSEGYWLNHDFLKINRLRPAFQEIKKFLAKTEEVVIMDIHRFPVGNFQANPERHHRLIDIIVSTFGPWMAPRSFGYDVTLNKLWSTGKRLLVAYNDEHYKDSPLLWPGIPQQWGNANSVGVLESFLDTAIIKSIHANSFWSISAALTPSFWDVAADKLNGLRGAADTLNHQLTKWLKTKYACSANIVSVDYFLSTDVIRTAIQCNLLRSKLVPRMREEEEEEEQEVVERSPVAERSRIIRASVLIQSEDPSPHER